MTVGELIAELQKFPAHYTAVIEHEDNSLSETTGLELQCDSIGEISLQTNNGPSGPFVKITQESL